MLFDCFFRKGTVFGFDISALHQQILFCWAREWKAQDLYLEHMWRGPDVCVSNKCALSQTKPNRYVGQVCLLTRSPQCILDFKSYSSRLEYTVCNILPRSELWVCSYQSEPFPITWQVPWPSLIIEGSEGHQSHTLLPQLHRKALGRCSVQYHITICCLYGIVHKPVLWTIHTQFKQICISGAQVPAHNWHCLDKLSGADRATRVKLCLYWCSDGVVSLAPGWLNLQHNHCHATMHLS